MDVGRKNVRILVSSDKLSVHFLRKSYVTNLADLGTPVYTLKKLIGGLPHTPHNSPDLDIT